jgi:hypothetical protein
MFANHGRFLHAERRFRQMVLVVRLHHLRLLEAQERLDTAREKVDSVINTTIEEVQHRIRTRDLADTPYHPRDATLPVQYPFGPPSTFKLLITNLKLITACEGTLPAETFT